jgi:hypothetical protein
LSTFVTKNSPIYLLIIDLLDGFSYTEEFLINIAILGADAIIAIEEY